MYFSSGVYSTAGDNFKPSSISSDVSKGGIYIVLLTIPPELQSHYGKPQIKKSTGERELKKAKRKQMTSLRIGIGNSGFFWAKMSMPN